MNSINRLKVLLLMSFYLCNLLVSTLRYRLHSLDVVWVFDRRKDCEDGILYPYEKRPNYN